MLADKNTNTVLVHFVMWPYIYEKIKDMLLPFPLC
jgi:hypothetical protein